MTPTMLTSKPKVYVPSSRTKVAQFNHFSSCAKSCCEFVTNSGSKPWTKPVVKIVLFDGKRFMVAKESDKAYIEPLSAPLNTVHTDADFVMCGDVRVYQTSCPLTPPVRGAASVGLMSVECIRYASTSPEIDDVLYMFGIHKIRN